jgi:hypothetical protein
MPYDVFEAVHANGGRLLAEEAVFCPARTATKLLGAHATWTKTLRAVAHVEAHARKQRPGSDLALVIVKSQRPD